jgi:ribosomal protein L32
MAVPKKRTSRMKRNIRKSKWNNKVLKQIIKSISLTKSIEKKIYKTNNQD